MPRSRYRVVPSIKGGYVLEYDREPIATIYDRKEDIVDNLIPEFYDEDILADLEEQISDLEYEVSNLKSDIDITESDLEDAELREEKALASLKNIKYHLNWFSLEHYETVVDKEQYPTITDFHNELITKLENL